jgi:excisionase family DNA binding protein
VISALPHFVTVPEAAKRARISEWSIRKEIREGSLMARRIGRVVRITDEELARCMRQGRRP